MIKVYPQCIYLILFSECYLQWVRKNHEIAYRSGQKKRMDKKIKSISASRNTKKLVRDAISARINQFRRRGTYQKIQEKRNEVRRRNEVLRVERTREKERRRIRQEERET